MTGGRSITIDIYAEDSTGKIYDIEVQCALAGADAHRARFHSSMIDTKILKEGQKFKELHDSYVIFITETDTMGAGLPIYHVERTLKETGAAFNDGSHIIYVNGNYKNDNSPLGKLMHDFRCTHPVDMFYAVLAEQVKYFKETEGGRKIMCKTFEELANKVAEARAEEEKKAFARRMLEKGKLTFEEIAEYADLSVEEVRALAKLQPA